MVQVDTQNGLDAQEILDEMKGAGHDYAPDKQAVRNKYSGQMATMYRPDDGRPVLVQAQYVDQYKAKGFHARKPSDAKLMEFRKETRMVPQHFAGLDNDEQPGNQVDAVDRFSDRHDLPSVPEDRDQPASATPPAPKNAKSGAQAKGQKDAAKDAEDDSATPPAPSTGAGGITTSADIAGGKP